jgi:hypothetical protein
MGTTTEQSRLSRGFPARPGRESIRWLAHEIRGYVRAYGEPIRASLIYQLLEDGYTCGVSSRN